MMWRSSLESLRQFDARWREQFAVSAASLGVFRVIFVLYTAAFGEFSCRWIAQLPRAFFSPHAFMFTSLVGGFPGATALWLLDLGMLSSLVLVLVGFRTRVATAALILLTLVSSSYRYSFGKIDHDILFQGVLLVMLGENWGSALSLDAHLARRRSANVPPYSLRPLAVILALAFATAGVPKALAWVDFDLSSSGFLSWFFPGYYVFGRTRLLADLVTQVRPLWLWELADVAAVVFELGFLVAVFRRRWMLRWLTVASVFHLVNCLVLNIAFTVNVIVYLTFVPWARLWPNLANVPPRPLLGAGLVALGLLVVRVVSSGAAPITLFGPEVALWVATCSWAALAALFGWLSLRAQGHPTAMDGRERPDCVECFGGGPGGVSSAEELR
jgi:hypothetical protein